MKEIAVSPAATAASATFLTKKQAGKIIASLKAEPDFATLASATFLPKKQFAALVQMSPRTVQNWCGTGMPHLIPGPRKILIEVAPALDWLRETFGAKGRVTSYRPRVRKSVGLALAAEQSESAVVSPVDGGKGVIL